MNGPNCKFRHALKSPEECPQKAAFDLMGKQIEENIYIYIYIYKERKKK